MREGSTVGSRQVKYPNKGVSQYKSLCSRQEIARSMTGDMYGVEEISPGKDCKGRKKNDSRMDTKNWYNSLLVTPIVDFNYET